MSRKKRREMFLFERFLSYAGFDAGIADVGENPDFLLRIDGRIVGAEVTELYISHEADGATLQAQESISERIVSHARRLYEEMGAPHAHVSVCFYSGRDLRRLRRDEAAEQLARYVARLNLNTWERVTWRPGFTPAPLPPEIAFINSLGVPAKNMSHWNMTRAGWVAPITVDRLQARIDEKAERLSTYKVRAAENWLILVADCTNPSQLFEVRSDFDPSEVSSPFSRTFLFLHPDRVLVELDVAARS